MNTQQAKQWMERLVHDLWSNLDEAQLANYYHQDVRLQFGKQVATFQDMVNRLRFVKKHYHGVHNKIEDVIVEGDKIVLRLEQSYGNHLKPHHIIAIYQLRAGKVSHLWACIDPVIDYFEQT